MLLYSNFILFLLRAIVVKVAIEKIVELLLCSSINCRSTCSRCIYIAVVQ